MKSYECIHHGWDKWTHYGMTMPVGVCGLKGKDCLGWCEDAEPREPDTQLPKGETP